MKKAVTRTLTMIICVIIIIISITACNFDNSAKENDYRSQNTQPEERRDEPVINVNSLPFTESISSEVERWEYIILDFHGSGERSRREQTEELNKLGAEGWELVNFCRNSEAMTFILKRPLR